MWLLWVIVDALTIRGLYLADLMLRWYKWTVDNWLKCLIGAVWLYLAFLLVMYVVTR